MALVTFSYSKIKIFLHLNTSTKALIIINAINIVNSLILPKYIMYCFKYFMFRQYICMYIFQPLPACLNIECLSR